MGEQGGDWCTRSVQLITVCAALKRKRDPKTTKTPAGLGLIKTVSLLEMFSEPDPEFTVEVDPCFKPFVSQGFVSFTGKERMRCW